MTITWLLQVLLVSHSFAASTGITDKPCEPQPGTKLVDFPQLCKYEAANAMLPASVQTRIVYFGDSITEMWGAQTPGPEAINRGASGQTTQQMVIRFKADVLDLKPSVVHLLMGTNDIAGNTGPTSIARIENDIAMMIMMARAQKIDVVMGTLLPTSQYPWKKDIDPVPAIRQLNTWIRDTCKRENLKLVDYFAAFDDGTGGFDRRYTIDGVHPNPAGYVMMSDLVRAVMPAK